MMIKVDGLTIAEAFARAVEAYADHEFMVVPKDANRDYCAAGWSCTFAEASARVDEFVRALRSAGYGYGHRVAVLLENRPEMLLLKLACNTLGASWVPINPDYRRSEMAYALHDSDAVLAVVAAGHEDVMRQAIEQAASGTHCVVWNDDIGAFGNLPRLATPAHAGAVGGPDRGEPALYLRDNGPAERLRHGA